MRSIRFGGPSLCAVALFTACLSVLTLAPEFTVADEPLPTMPEGAGKADADAPTEFTATESGLKYRVLRKGSGEKPTGADTVEVNYHGWLDDGKVFDSSYKRGESISFPLNRVIPGWTEGMQLVGEGGMIGAPAAITNAVEDALTPFGATVTTQYLPPTKILELARVIPVE